MRLRTLQYAQSNYGDDIFEVIGVRDGIKFRDFIKELDEFHNGKHNNSSIWMYDSKEKVHSFNYLFKVNIPGRKNTDISDLTDEILDKPVCCHNASGFWGANTYFVYFCD